MRLMDRLPARLCTGACALTSFWWITVDLREHVLSQRPHGYSGKSVRAHVYVVLEERTSTANRVVVSSPSCAVLSVLRPRQAGVEIQKSSSTLSPQQIAALASAFKERAKFLHEGPVSPGRHPRRLA